MRIVFALMNHLNPTSGGLQVLREHMRYLYDAGFNVAVYYYNDIIRTSLAPFTDTIYPMLHIEDVTTEDIVIVAEEFVWVCESDLIPRNLRYVIVNQGLFATFSGDLPFPIYQTIYDNAEFVLVNSDHTEKGIIELFQLPRNKVYKFRLGIDSNRYYPAKKENLISFMSYKNGVFGNWMHLYISGKYKNFKVEKMHMVSREESMRIFQKSKLFLSYGGPEGFGLPPLEAAFCGCKVIGFHGYGGAEYWREPVFTSIPFIDHISFIEKLKDVIETIDYWDQGALEYVDFLRDFYSVESARKSVVNFYKEKYE
jgi:glycosyltransferase involved in cell wall biosynthesis